MARDKNNVSRRSTSGSGERSRIASGVGLRIGNWLMGLVRQIWAGSWLISVPVACFLAIALASYSPADASFSVSTDAPTHNWAGPYGAYAADTMLLTFGRSAWWFVLGFAMIAFFAIRSLVRRQKGETDPLRINPPKLTAFVGFAALLIGSTCLEALRLRRFKTVLPGEAGGILGDKLAFGLYHYVGLGLATVLFFTLIVIGLSLLMDFQWQDVAEKVGEFLDRWIFRRFRTMKQNREEARLSSEASKETREEFRKNVLEADENPLYIKTAEQAVVPEVNAEENILPEEQSVAPELMPVEPQVTRFELAGQNTPVLTPAAPVESARAVPTPTKVATSQPVAPQKEAAHLSLDLLDNPPPPSQYRDDDAIALASRLIVSKLKSYNIEAAVRGAHSGPVITQYLLEPGPGVKGSQIESVQDDLRRALGVQSVRVVPHVPNTTYIGLEVPNPTRETVRLKEIIASDAFRNSTAPLTLALGKDIGGVPKVMDLAKGPHLLVAGTTGSGKSVGINAMILSMLYRNDPSKLRLVLIDPKMLEFALYNGIPHLICPVVTEMSRAAMALKWLTREMDRRYAIMSHFALRHISDYNAKVRNAIARGESIPNPIEDAETATPLEPWPYIVCVIDELADLMLTNRKEVEGELIRLAQKARAAGMHLILATQRPSREVVTSLLKANVPTRIAFQVASPIDSRVIFNESGAESLLGWGDMLYSHPGEELVRIQGCFVKDDEVLRVVEELKKYGEPDYAEELMPKGPEDSDDSLGGSRGEADPLYDKAVSIVVNERRASVSSLQRALGVGYNRAANIVEAMEKAGIVSKATATGKREILVPKRD